MPRRKKLDEPIGLAQKFHNLPEPIQDELRAYMEDKKTPLSDEAELALWELIIPILLSEFRDDLLAIMRKDSKDE